MNSPSLIHQLTELLTQGNAHVTFEESIKGLPVEQRGIKPHKMLYNIWQLVEHIRIAQWDILKFSEGPDHQSPKWPDEYWPEADSPSTEVAWKHSLQQIQADKQAFIQLLQTREDQLLKPFPYGNGQNLFREALLIADHTSYHTGQIILMRRLLGSW
jgi:uncharacterized damage-inducible protein DinB